MGKLNKYIYISNHYMTIIGWEKVKISGHV